MNGFPYTQKCRQFYQKKKVFLCQFYVAKRTLQAFTICKKDFTGIHKFLTIFWTCPIWWNVKKNPAILVPAGFPKTARCDFQLKKSFIIGPMSHYFPALYKFDSVVLLRLDRCDLRGLEDANLEHLSTLKRVKILKMLESLTAVERYRMLWQLLLTVESCDSFYELWQLLSDVRSGGFNKLWNLRQTLVCRLTDKAKQSYWT